MSLADRLRLGPDPDLSHLPVSLDLRALSIAEGARAALSVAAIVAIGQWAQVPALGEAALGALLTCLCDPGGPIRRRMPAMLTFVVLGAFILAALGALRGSGAGLVVVAVLASALIFCNSFARVWDQPAMQVGNILTVVTVLALDHGTGLNLSVVLGGMFLAGGLWATALTLLLWRIYPYRPARRAAAEAFRRLAALTADLSALLAQDDLPPDWAAHARAHRRYVRDGIEQARTLVLDTIRGRGQAHAGANALLLQVETADQLFGALIALSDVLEHGEPGARDAARTLLPALRLLFAAIADGVQDDPPTERDREREMIERLLAGLVRGTDSPALRGITAGLIERLRIAALLTTAEGQFAYGETPSRGDSPQARLLAPIRANLTWQSTALRHATRAAVVALPALLLTLSLGGIYAHWLTITLVLTLQPFFALTWQRALERIGGTVLGGVLAAAIAALVHTPIATAAILFPIALIAFSVRAVSFGLFMAALTPMVVLLSELGQPGQSEFVIAAWRAAYTVLGGLIAVAGGALLWPTWEPSRVRDELRRAIRAHAAFADLELGAMLGEPADGLEAARRVAGVSTNNLEASLSRALQEPRRAARPDLQAAMVADAALRRTAGRLAALQYEPGLAGVSDLAAWRAWLRDAFAALEAGTALPGPAPAGAAPDGLLPRIARQIDLMDGALRPAGTAPPAAPSRPPSP